MENYIKSLLNILHFKEDRINKEDITEILNKLMPLFGIMGYEIVFELGGTNSCDIINKMIVIDFDELNELSKIKNAGEYNIFVLEVLIHELIHIDNFNEIFKNTKYKEILTFLHKDSIGYINAQTEEEKNYYLREINSKNNKNIYSIHERITNIKTNELLLMCCDDNVLLKEYFKKSLNNHITSGYFFNRKRTNIKSIFEHYYGVDDFKFDDYYSRILFGLEINLEDESKLVTLIEPIKEVMRPRF